MAVIFAAVWAEDEVLDKDIVGARVDVCIPYSKLNFILYYQLQYA